ncbi:type III secretion system outer membrane ring subunit SctC [Paraburkholderia humisilvae]|nr:type III secretion system outer membrane ring subunit SctC [Paraburkholderia humisilvae]
MNWTARLNAIAVCAMLALGSTTRAVQAAPVHWKSPGVDYAAGGKDINDVLRELGASEGIAIHIDAGVNGKVSGKFHLPPQRFLDLLASSFGFVWYYDGEVLDIVPASDMQSTLVKLDMADTAALRDKLERTQVADERFQIVYDGARGTALVNGPPRYVQLVTRVAEQLDADEGRRAGVQVRVFPLNHAWAQDRPLALDGQQLTLQGVASVLNDIYHPRAVNAAGSAGATNSMGRADDGVARNTPAGDVNRNAYASPYGAPPVAGASRDSGLIGQSAPAALQTAGATPRPALGANASSVPDDALPVIVADQRTNSIVIRDTGDRMTQYGKLIERLDVKPELIEIEAHIIEIDDRALRELGIDWTLHDSRVDRQTGSDRSPQSTGNDGAITRNVGDTPLPGNGSARASPAGASVAAVLDDGGRYLMARLAALQQHHAAKIDASPKVVTANNIEAVMDNRTQFYVPVAGYTGGDLYSVSTGMSLRVLPMVFDEGGQTHIKLDVAIQDGELMSQTVSNLPVVQRSRINTEAFIDEGQALLIAGYRTDNDLNSAADTPGWSKVPVIGALFGADSNSTRHRERLVLLSPRVISP